MKITAAVPRGYPASSLFLAILVWCHCLCTIAYARSHRSRITSSTNGTEPVVDCELVRPFFKNVTLTPATADTQTSKSAFRIRFRRRKEKKGIHTPRRALILRALSARVSLGEDHVLAALRRARWTMMSKSGDSDISGGRAGAGKPGGSPFRETRHDRVFETN